MSVLAKVSTGLAIFAAVTQPAFAYLGTGDIVLRASLLELTREGEARVLCASEQEIETSLSAGWELGAPPEARGSLEAICHSLTVVKPVPAMGMKEVCTTPPLTIGVSAYVRRESESERSVVVTVQAAEATETCASEAGRAQASKALLDRELTFSEDAAALVPVSLDNGVIGEAATTLVARFETEWIPPSNRTQFGTVYMESDVPSGAVFLDGGAVGTMPETGLLVLPYVRPGLRTVRVERPGQADQLGFVRIRSGRAFRLALGRAPSPPDRVAALGLESLGPNERGFREFRRAGDGATMVEIPEGEFLMGNVQAERSPHEHKVYLSTFLIDKLAVTWGQYLGFLAATGKPMPPHRPYWGIHEDHPAVYVTRQEALNYCTWTGARLPTEAEREKAARGTDGRTYPWGEEAPAPQYAVFRRQWGKEATDPVGIRPMGASPYGVLDMGGNVWEWCLDWYSDDYLESSPYRDPPGPESGTRHVLRGGSWDSRPDVTSASVRNWGHPGYREGDYGFRCAMNAPPE